MFWQPKKPQSKIEQAKSAALDTAHHLGESLEDLKEAAARRLAASKAQLDEATQQALKAAEKEAAQAQKAALKARKTAEKEAEELAGRHEKWKSRVEKEQLELERQAHEKAQTTRAQLEHQIEAARRGAEEELAQIRAKRLHFDDRKALEIEAHDGEIEVREVQKGNNIVFFIVGAVVLAGAGLYYVFSGTNGRRSRAAIKDRIEHLKDAVTRDDDVEPLGAPDSVDLEAVKAEIEEEDAEEIVVVEVVEEAAEIAPQSDESKISALTGKVSGAVVGAGEALADKIEKLGENAHAKAHDLSENVGEKADEITHKLDETAAPTPANEDAESAVHRAIEEAEETVKNIEKAARNSR